MGIWQNQYYLIPLQVRLRNANSLAERHIIYRVGIWTDVSDLKPHAWAFCCTWEGGAATIILVDDLTVKELVVTLCGKLWWWEGPATIYLYCPHLEPMKIFNGSLWGWNLTLAEFEFISLWHCQKEDIQLSWSRDRHAGPVNTLKKTDGGRERHHFQQPTSSYALGKTGTMYFHLIETRIYESHKLCGLIQPTV